MVTTQLRTDLGYDDHGIQNYGSTLKSKLIDYEQDNSATANHNDNSASDVDVYIMTIPSNLPLDVFDNVSIVENTVQETVIPVPKKLEECREIPIQSSRYIVTHVENSLHSDNMPIPVHVLGCGSNNNSRKICSFQGSINVTELNLLMRPDDKHFLQRPPPPSMPTGLKNRLKLFGWKSPGILTNSSEANVPNCRSTKKLKHKKRKHKRKLEREEASGITLDNGNIDGSMDASNILDFTSPPKKKKTKKKKIH